MDTQRALKEASSLIELWRYKTGTSEALKHFVCTWAFMQSGLYKPKQAIVSKDDFDSAGAELSWILSELMLAGLSDPLAILLSEHCKDTVKSQSYYPTPEPIGALISALTTDTDENNGPVSLYEPCCGSAGITLEKLEALAFKRAHLENPLEGVTITAEDISEIAVKAFFIQIVHKLQYLTKTLKKKVTPDCIYIAQIDVLSRKKGSVIYHLEGNHL